MANKYGPLAIEGILAGGEFHQTNGHSFAEWLAVHDRAVKAEARAEGTREAAAYIDRLHPAGLTSKAAVLADLEIAADRHSRHLLPIGRDRADQIEGATE